MGKQQRVGGYEIYVRERGQKYVGELQLVDACRREAPTCGGSGVRVKLWIVIDSQEYK